MIHELVIACMLGLIGGVIPGPVITAVFTEILQSGITTKHEDHHYCPGHREHGGRHQPDSFRIAGPARIIFQGTVPGGCGHPHMDLRFHLEGQIPGYRIKVHFSFWKIIIMILSNGVLWTYWITICIPKAILLSEQIHLGAYLFMGLVQLGWLISTLLVAFTFSRFRSILSRPRVIPVIFKIFALAFAYFALDMAIQEHHFFYQVNRTSDYEIDTAYHPH